MLKPLESLKVATMEIPKGTGMRGSDITESSV